MCDCATAQGGNRMDYKITKMRSLKLVGFQKEFSPDTSYIEIPKFWSEIFRNFHAGNASANPCVKAMIDYRIGEYGVCVDDLGADKFRYMIAGKYTGGEIPDGMMLYEFPAGDWAIFDCFGPNPETLQAANTEIFRHWLPENPEYKLSVGVTIEWYDCTADQNDPNYHSAVWIPVKRKQIV